MDDTNITKEGRFERSLICGVKYCLNMKVASALKFNQQGKIFYLTIKNLRNIMK
jgi:hypothetical protein